MSIPTLPPPDAALEDRIRATLHAVASTVRETSETSGTAAHGTGRTSARPTAHARRGRRLALVGGAVAVTTALAAAAVVNVGPEYVDELPPDHVIVSGEADGGRYWLVEMTRRVGCAEPPLGVELVIEEGNIIGQEWNSFGLGYGDVTGGGCDHDSSAALRDPARAYSGGAFSGDTFLVMYAVHPRVTALTVTFDDRDTATLPVHRVDGAGYTVFEVPSSADSYTVRLLSGDAPVPGSEQSREVPTP
ncbi:MAG: hypothetical protein AVDCRST_MAG34-942 [uncultured Nocardioidaceae bacterium]|uniref:Uncharacterized protein n=1 Tax=uncultured Nocardioidaceae bacterium TaxID=253824 RepID=A0A6J4LTI7_9ACTN|nr:MAG: hypothetical protein AVDCRST_MAG34-942 [uncultured Nocardioidaceae bacterium]